MSRDFQAPYMVPDTISASEMQGLQPPLYPSDIPNIAGEPFNLAEEDSNMWAPDPSLPTVDPSFLAGGSTGMPPYFTNPKTFDTSLKQTRRSSDEAEFNGSSYRVRHGQVTPPSDLSPTTTFSAPNKPSIQTSVEAEEPTKRRRSSRVQGGRNSIARSSISSERSFPGDEKQEKTRARNRLAASKCRQKKKEQNNQLESRYEQERIRNEELTRMVTSLRGDIVAFKTQLLAHSECRHEPVQAYIRGMANNIAGGRQSELSNLDVQYPGCGSEQKAGNGFEFDASPAV
ncbi:hypothetical protein BDV18DRAFT_147513 [Aspergillus unguis]